MRFKWLVLVTAAAIVSIVPAAGAARTSTTSVTSFSPRQSTILGIVPVHSVQPFVQGNGDLTYHGGPVMHTNQTYTIFWAPSGFSYPAGYENLVNQYFTDVGHDSGGNQNVYPIDNQYFDGAGNITYSSTFSGTIDDTHAYPASGCVDGFGTTKCLTDAQLQAEIKSVVAAQGWPHNGTTEYFMVTPQNVGSCFDSSSTQCSYSLYCAYHSSFNVTGGEEIYANMPFAHVSGCSTGQSPNANAADDVINVISHEHNEAITDWQGNAWFDAAGFENGDKCNFDFGSPLGGGAGAEYNQVINGDHYWIQREYDNSTHSCLQRPAASGGPAVVSSIKPTALGQGAKGAKVTITGSNFLSGATVSVSGSGVTVGSVTFTGTTQITAKLTVASGATIGARDVSVTNPGASAGTCSGCLTIDLGPTVASTSPSSGARGSTMTVKVLGANFVNGAKVTINKGVTVNSRTFVNAGEIDINITIASATTAGGRTVTVKNPDHGVGTLTNGFTVT
jgi:IPT/TIG domain-containing protein